MKKNLILAIETSCDETSIAIVGTNKKVYANIISSQIDLHAKYGGVVPELASREHMKNLSLVLNEALLKAKKNLSDINYIAVTKTPGLIGPLLTGISFAKGLAYGLNIELILVDHLKAHVYANFLEHEIDLPAICLLVSGGHTQIIKLTKNHEFLILGETLDDAVGECYDKVARIMQLGYPGGPAIDKICRDNINHNNINTENKSNNIKIPNPKVDGEYNFSFSGIKTYALNYINRKNMKKEKIDKIGLACSFQNKVVEILMNKTLAASQKEGIKNILLSGGVSANSHLRNKMQEECDKLEKKIFFPKLEYCTDNAAMVGMAAVIFIESQKVQN